MGDAFGKNFTSTDKKLPSDFFKVMFDTMSKSIEDSRMVIEEEMKSMVSNAKSFSNIDSISEFSSNDDKAKEFMAVYETPRFPQLPEGIDKKYWTEFLD